MTANEKYPLAECRGLLNTIRQRRSVRAFSTDPVSGEDLKLILDTARYAPSGGNTQPWRVQVLGKETIGTLNSAICAHIQSHGFTDVGDYRFYPDRQEKDYWDLILQSGRDLHEALELGRRDVQEIRAQKMKNFNFYGAPVGLIVTLDRKLAQGSWVDVGLFLGSLVLAAHSINFGTCLQGCFSSYGDIVRDVVGLNPDDLVVCGIALGHPEAQAAINDLPQRRLETNQFVRYHP